MQCLETRSQGAQLSCASSKLATNAPIQLLAQLASSSVYSTPAAVNHETEWTEMAYAVQHPT
jgi:hypothetical protein